MGGIKRILLNVKNKLIGQLIKSEIESLFLVRDRYVNLYNVTGDEDDLKLAYSFSVALIYLCYDYKLTNLFDKYHHFYELDIRN